MPTSTPSRTPPAENLTLNRIQKRFELLQKKLLFQENDPRALETQEKIAIEGKLEALANQIAETQKIRRAAQQARLTELNTIINQIETQIETPSFRRKFEVSEKIFRQYRLQQSVKPALTFPEFRKNLHRTNFKPQLSRPNWLNALADAEKAAKIRATANRPEFDISKPLSSTEKLITNFVTKQPQLALYALAGLSATALILTLKKGLVSKTVGVLTGAAAGLLGLKYLKLNVKKKISDFVQAKTGLSLEKVQADLEKSDPNYDPQSEKFDLYTQQISQEIAEYSPIDAGLWRWLRATLKSAVPITLSPKSIQENLKRLEDGETFTSSERDDLLRALFSNDTLIKVGAAGIGIFCFGASFIWEISKQEIRLFKSVLRWLGERNPAHFREMSNDYFIGFLAVGGAAGLQEFAKGLFGKGEKLKLPRVLMRGVVAGSAWPIYALEVGGRMASTSARLAGKYTPLGYLKYTGKTLRVIEAGGQIVQEILAPKWISGEKRVRNAKIAARRALKESPRVPKVRETARKTLEKGNKLIQTAQRLFQQAQTKIQPILRTAASQAAEVILKTTNLAKSAHNWVASAVLPKIPAPALRFITLLGTTLAAPFTITSSLLTHSPEVNAGETEWLAARDQANQILTRQIAKNPDLSSAGKKMLTEGPPPGKPLKINPADQEALNTILRDTNQAIQTANNLRPESTPPIPLFQTPTQ